MIRVRPSPIETTGAIKADEELSAAHQANERFVTTKADRRNTPGRN
jgi:hypothetical protein